MFKIKTFLSVELYFFLAVKAFANGVVGVPLSPIEESTNLVRFEVRAFSAKDKILVYQAQYGLYESFGTTDEAGEKVKTPPFVDCRYKSLKKNQSSEWGIVRFGEKKPEVVVPRKPARSLKNCTPETSAKQDWKAFENKVKKMGIKLDKSLDIQSFNTLSTDLKAEIIVGSAMIDRYLALKNEDKVFAKSEFCEEDIDDSETLAYLKGEGKESNRNGLVLLSYKEKNIFVMGFCENRGAMSNSYSFEMMGVVGNKDGFVVLIKERTFPGAHAGLHESENVLMSPLLSLH